MATGILAAAANSIVTAIATGSAYDPSYTTLYLVLHTGDPGAAGTANASAETLRKALTFGSASGGVIAATQVVWSTWSAGSETLTHISLWDALTSGNFVMSGTLNSTGVVNGNNAGVTVTLSYTPIAA